MIDIVTFGDSRFWMFGFLQEKTKVLKKNFVFKIQNACSVIYLMLFNHHIMRILLLLLFCIPLTLFCQNFNESAISKKVLEKVEQDPDAYQPILIMLESQLNFSQLVNDFDESNISTNERATIVINALKNNADATQKEVLNFLDTATDIIAESTRKFWVANLIFVKAKPEVIAQLSHREDVAWIALSGQVKIENAAKATVAPPSPNDIEPGLAVVGAPFMWALGYTGYGQLAFTNDTGVDRFHPTYEGKYRGLFVETTAAWYQYDTTTMQQLENAIPFDRNGHGTHVNGTILGLDRLENDTIGVAFNSQWIGAAILSNGIGTEDNIGSFEWALDPDGNPDTVEDMPDVINNSWYDPTLDEEDCTSIYVPILEALEAAGIVVIYSAGNEGPGPMTITQPHNINVNLVNTFTVGALNGNNANLPIAGFSSRGPSHCGGEGSLLIKPEVSAPGVNVRSARPNGTYGNLSGTSMAAPHTSGCILLLKEAFPNLTAVELKEALYFSCIDLGDQGEDNTYGMGVINVENAYNYLLDLGHTPVSPFKNNDVLLIDFTSSNVSCEEAIVTDVLVENAGTDTLFSFNVNYEIGGVQAVHNWEGVLAPTERVEVKLLPLNIVAGDYFFNVEVAEPNGMPDERPLNNRLARPVKVVTRPLIDAFALENITVCENSNALLQANYDGDGQVEFQWYDASEEGDLLGTGNFYLAENLTASTTIYASGTYIEKVGKGTFDTSDAIEIDSTEIGLEFDAHTPFKLKSVLVYSVESGGRQINMFDVDGNTLGSTVVFLDTGFVRANLNFDVPIGNGHRLVKGVAKSLHMTEDAPGFPYEINGVCTINKGVGYLGEDVYPLYYDWEIEYENPCIRTPVNIDVLDAENLPIADFSSSVDTVNLNLDETGEVTFMDNSTDAASWLWHFDDGTTSLEQNPTHFYETAGNYQVTLTVTDEDGCSHSTIQNLVVIFVEPTAVKPSPDNSSEVVVYPNPMTDNLQIAFFLNQRQAVKLTLVDAVGNEIKRNHTNTFYQENINWNLADLSAGVYYLIFEIEGEVMVKKVVKI